MILSIHNDDPPRSCLYSFPFTPINDFLGIIRAERGDKSKRILTFAPKLKKKFLQTMINRVLIRIKVLQIVYSYYQNETHDLKLAEKELMFSLQKSYNLYYYLLLLMVEVTRLHRRNLDLRKHKYVPGEEDLNPNTRLIDNRFVAQLEINEMLRKQIDAEGISWANDEDFVKDVLDSILVSDIYAEYLKNPEDNYETDREFWRQVFKKLICNSQDVEEYLEDKSIYWNDDVAIIETFALKTIKRFEEAKGSKQPLLPMFKDDEDRLFATKLLHQALLRGIEFRNLIDKHMTNWEAERIATMDMHIMQIALAELFTFPTIPTIVTLNEYIDLAKYYSTPKSGHFINGILDTIVKELKNQQLLLKD